MAIQINTALVLEAADDISAVNLALKSGFDEIDRAISDLKASWSGSACDTCCRKADYLRAQYKDARYAVVEDFVRFLRLQVGEGYDTAETVISSAADAFK